MVWYGIGNGNVVWYGMVSVTVTWEVHDGNGIGIGIGIGIDDGNGNGNSEAEKCGKCILLTPAASRSRRGGLSKCQSVS